MKECVKTGIYIYVGLAIAQSIDKGFGLSDKLTKIISKIKFTEDHE